MKKEKKKIMLGEEFTENKKMEKGYYSEFKTLGDCYNSWSYRKQAVFDNYKNLLNNNCDEVLNYGIRSYNSNVIILHAEVMKENKKYYLVITPSYNWFNEI